MTAAEPSGEPCAQPLRITPGNFHGSFRCPQCHADWTAQRLLLVALNDPRVTIWAYPGDTADALGIPERTIRHWRQHGHIPTNGSRIDAGATYRLRHQRAVS